MESGYLPETNKEKSKIDRLVRGVNQNVQVDASNGIKTRVSRRRRNNSNLAVTNQRSPWGWGRGGLFIKPLSAVLSPDVSDAHVEDDDAWRCGWLL